MQICTVLASGPRWKVSMFVQFLVRCCWNS